ncbi:hypothetical protein TGDOM2_227060 [Toxoplasma gondii GAB2-2007-GAL-DOM2]|uniref:Uncharacterized protein n=1 Tax=Toxoplasma gondii GAB2-2007-GAL-DOM2 TaxID=1130820 RepID=A0A086KLB1_TOXGO|nr:hypothetical protein TGDOM2_227060 [Toxoplasma gondii GAB2-2007-GAL-DOM2]
MEASHSISTEGEAVSSPASSVAAGGVCPCDRPEKPLPLPSRLEIALQSLLHCLDRTANAWQVQQLFLFQQELTAFHSFLQEQAGALDEESRRFLEAGEISDRGTVEAGEVKLSSRLFSFLIRIVLRSIVNRPMFEEAASPVSPCSSPASTATAQSSSKCSSFFDQVRRFSLLLHVTEERTLLASYPPLPSLKVSEEPESSSSSSQASLHTLLLSAQASLKAKRAAIEQLFSFLHDSELQSLLLTPSIPDLAALNLLKIDASVRALLPSLRRTASALADATAREALRSSSVSESFASSMARQRTASQDLSASKERGGTSAENEDMEKEDRLAEDLLMLWTSSLRRFLKTSLGVYVHSDAGDEQQRLVDLAFVGLSPTEFAPRLLEQFLALCASEKSPVFPPSLCSLSSLSPVSSPLRSCLPQDITLPALAGEEGQEAHSRGEQTTQKRRRTEGGIPVGAHASLEVFREVLLCSRDFLTSLFHTLDSAWSAAENKSWRLRDEARTEDEEAFYVALVEAASLCPSFSAFVECSENKSQEIRSNKKRQGRPKSDEGADTPPFLPFHFSGPGEGHPSLANVLLSQRAEGASLPNLQHLVCGLVDLLLAHAASGIGTAQCPACGDTRASREAKEVRTPFCISNAPREPLDAHGEAPSAAGVCIHSTGLAEPNSQPVSTSLSDRNPERVQREGGPTRELGNKRREREATEERETTDLESLQTCIPLAFSLCGSFLKLLRFCVDLGSPLPPSFSPTLARFSAAPAFSKASGVEGFVAEATWACLRRCMQLEWLATRLWSSNAVCTYTRTTRLALGFRCAPVLVSIAVHCTQPRWFLIDGEELRDEAVEDQLAEQTTANPFSLTSLFAAMQTDEAFRRDVFAVCAFDPKFRFLLYRLPYSLALGALEFLSVHAPKEARRRWPLYVLIGSVRAADEDKQDGAWLEAAMASALVQQAPSARPSSFLFYSSRQGNDEASKELDAFSAATLYKELLAAASECEDFVPQRLVFLGLARSLAAGPRVASPNTTLHLQQQLRHLQLRTFPASSLLDNVSLDMLAAKMQCCLLGRCRGVMDKVEVFEQVLSLVEKRLNEDFAKRRLFAVRTLRELARLLPSLLLSEALMRPSFIKFWALVFKVDAAVFLSLSEALDSPQKRQERERRQATREEVSAFSAPDLGLLLETLFYELICRYSPCLLALQPNAAPPDENAFAALQTLLSTEKGSFISPSLLPADPGGSGGSAETGEKRRDKKRALRDLLLLLLTFYVEKQHEIASAAPVPLFQPV